MLLVNRSLVPAVLLALAMIGFLSVSALTADAHVGVTESDGMSNLDRWDRFVRPKRSSPTQIRYRIEASDSLAVAHVIVPSVSKSHFEVL